MEFFCKDITNYYFFYSFKSLCLSCLLLQQAQAYDSYTAEDHDVFMIAGRTCIEEGNGAQVLSIVLDEKNQVCRHSWWMIQHVNLLISVSHCITPLCPSLYRTSWVVWVGICCRLWFRLWWRKKTRNFLSVWRFSTTCYRLSVCLLNGQYSDVPPWFMS